MSLAGRPPLSQRLLARLTFGQVLCWSRPKDTISKRGVIEVVSRLDLEESVLEGLVIGQKDGPWPPVKAKTRSPLQKLCLSQGRTKLDLPYKSFVFPKEGQNAISPGGDGMMEVIVPVSYTIDILNIQFTTHQNNIIITFTMAIVATGFRLIPASSGGAIHG
jgi:hypothetical protein